MSQPPVTASTAILLVAVTLGGLTVLAAVGGPTVFAVTPAVLFGLAKLITSLRDTSRIDTTQSVVASDTKPLGERELDSARD